jgi:hypothetical protein
VTARDVPHRRFLLFLTRGPHQKTFLVFLVFRSLAPQSAQYRHTQQLLSRTTRDGANDADDKDIAQYRTHAR